MKQEQKIQGKLVSVLGSIALAMLGVGVALGMTELLLRKFPNWVPREVRVNPPVRRVQALVDETYDLRQSDGDLYYLMQGAIMPLSPDEDQVVAHVHMITDAHGFRNSSSEMTTYDIVALGDSFTRASGVAFSWPQKLTEYSGSDVLNLGDVGFGPQDELKVLRQYGLKKQPDWVIMAYFEGNDLHDAAAYEQANPFILTRFAKYILDQSFDAWQARGGDNTQAGVTPSYQYPIMVTINNKDLEMSFFPYYIAWSSVSREEIESSQNYRITRETILQVQELSEAAEARFLLVYVPSKEHVYLPYLNGADILARVFTDVPTIELDEAGFLQFKSEKATQEGTSKHLDDQASLLADFAVENHIFFLDLTPRFQEEAGRGAELYYSYDTHWNQKGHDLAAEMINEFMQEMLPDTSGKTPGN
jgi:hypothetical protein